MLELMANESVPVANATREIGHVMLYRSLAYALGSVIVLSNLTVVVSSGLILRKGQQLKSTYLLLGNVSLADTFIGVSLIFRTSVHRIVTSDAMCVLQIGMIVCPTMVSIFSVGLIAVDRYIYILHGLYYQQWINTTRVRIAILFVWLVGLTLGFLPATGWVNQELKGTRCAYISVFPAGLIVINATLSVIPIAVVAVLYVKILILALRNLRNIKNAKKQAHESKDGLRVYRGNFNGYGVKGGDKIGIRIHRSSSMSDVDRTKKSEDNLMVPNNVKSKSINDLNSSEDRAVTDDDVDSKPKNDDSKLSILTIQTDFNKGSSKNVSTLSLSQSPKEPNNPVEFKTKDTRRLRAVVVVMLTSGSVIVTWLPYFIFVCFYAFCTDKVLNPKCISLNDLLRGPLAMLAFLNSILNPLIYAWWHRGFQSAVKLYFKKHCCKQR